jgi:signal transduction histidine kinase
VDFTAYILISALAGLLYLVLFFRVVWRSNTKNDQQPARWLLMVLALATLTSVVGLMPEDTELGGPHLTTFSLMVYIASLLLVVYSGLTMIYLRQNRLARLTVILGGIWWIALLGLSLADSAATLGEASWFVDMFDEPTAVNLLPVVGWGVILLSLLAITFYKFYSAHLPEIANRALFWAIMLPLVTLGVMLNASGESPLREIGALLQVAGILGTAYGVISLRVIDLRRILRGTAVNIVVIVTATLVIFASLLVVDSLEVDNDLSQAVVFLSVAVIAALLYMPLNSLTQLGIKRIFRQNKEDLSGEMGRFAEAITAVVEFNELTDVVMRNLRDVVRVRRGCLILITDDKPSSVRVEPHPNGMGEIPTIHGWLDKQGPIYENFYTTRKPLLQFDLDLAPDYVDVTPAERDFFRQMRMAAYAPIVVQGELIGILACGPKSNDDPFYPKDMEVLTTIANQTGVALRNARLVDDLRKREHDVAETNRRIEATKRQLEALDAVKTDFITIASHELRTPLAQIRGHTDIIEALNEQGMLDQDQLGSLTKNLRKATDRLEALIGDMLDVSQLDLSAMDLRLSEISVENAVRMAIEPLQESIRNRKQSLTARGLRGLPAIQADMQRLVQAIRNIVLNAVKFTPDGGRIEIIGTLMSNEMSGADEIQITIKDSGIGIDPKHHEAIFEKFFRTGDPSLHSTGQTKFMGAGPGLGLTIAKGVIEGHSGRISVESEGYSPEENPGSTFYIVLPVKPPEGERHVLTFGTSTGAHRPVNAAEDDLPEDKSPTRAKKQKPAPVPVEANGSQETAEDEPSDETEAEPQPFVEENRTVLNPSASRAGLAAAAKAAAEKAAASMDDGGTTDKKKKGQDKSDG